MPHGPAADIGLRHLVHGNGAHYPGGHPGFLQGVLEGQGVDHGGQHAHVVGHGPVDPLGAGFQAPEDVAAAHHDADFHLQVNHVLDFPGDGSQGGGVQAEFLLPGQAFAAHLEEDAAIFEGSRCHAALAYAPTW